ncbi:triosephosphate isomerase [Tanticharoenia sakaeratensis NBRC 103193]|uniref:Triosephosphate isomerase n=2 Tax=Tanticharoenia TaxID=444052 RepID=A0A0D6MIN6_9PROT|nr:triosephosphate isomerase [Tanticharoenia sakaeratensis NBRC 103193]
MTMRRRLVVGNWKMHGLCAQSAALARGVRDGARALAHAQGMRAAEIVLCPPFTQLTNVHRLLVDASGDARSPSNETTLAPGQVGLGAQDCHVGSFGAYTGDVSAAMLADVGATHVILGHSERRLGHGEIDSLVRDKAASAMEAGLTPIICLGETQKEREAGQATARVSSQIMRSVPDGFAGVIAYEPIWAIGTGAAATLDDIAAIAAPIRTALRERLGPAGDDVRLLYGGSVTPKEAPGILGLGAVDGVLVGGASLQIEKFLAIAEAAGQA